MIIKYFKYYSLSNYDNKDHLDNVRLSFSNLNQSDAIGAYYLVSLAILIQIMQAVEPLRLIFFARIIPIIIHKTFR